ncbi:rho-related GTP-binding protein RhoA-D-like [Histomonas meleagridis]|uniref:rho-related GTP-binding protein RhoA-D-like n=1 Tax=Histomonas meleagridis TaxID=135588 RepID=UPI00355A5B30|nr:rho-related GTP-binding protein RhoA-D-like [Histomonas meleagridis]KAH0803239.1 rho-related GTP-binding protein RhoA-D-like [Histomonas meleagridis]
MSSKSSIPVRIVAVGDGAVGKTSMLLVFKGEPFPEDYEPSIFENHHEMRNFQGKTYCLHLWDTAGQEEYDRLRPMSYAKCDVVLICFSLDNKESLKNVVDKWKLEIIEYCPKAAVILVGTKSDLWDKNADGAITQEDIDNVAKQVKAFKTITCSAKNNTNIGNVFDLAIAAAINKNGGGCTIA